MTSRMAAAALVAALVALVAGVDAAAPATPAAKADSEWTRPSFCRDLECPRFQVVKKISDNIELRRYEPGTWASTTMPGTDSQAAMSGSFMRLFNYIQGSNEGQQRISMTAPVLARVGPTNTTVGFFNPYKYQGAGAAPTPKPTDPSVSITALPALEVYVLSYGGFSNGDTQKAKRDDLVAALKAAKLPYDGTTWFAAGYNAPFEIFNRHNEVMIPVKPIGPGTPAAPAKAAAVAPVAKGTAAAKPSAAGRRLRLA